MREWSIDRLASHHNRDTFDCGKPLLSQWLKQQARQFENRDLSRVYVSFRAGMTQVLGYYALANSQVGFEILPTDRFKKFPPRMPIPAVLIGKLAVDVSVKGQGLGSLLLMSAFRRIQDLAEQIGICAIVVNAIDDDARNFYLHFGFTELLDDPHHLFLPLEQVRKLGLPPLQ